MRISKCECEFKGSYINVHVFPRGKLYQVRYKEPADSDLDNFVEFERAINKLVELSESDEDYDELQGKLAGYEFEGHNLHDFDLQGELSTHYFHVEDYIDIVKWLEKEEPENQPAELEEAA